MQVHARLLIKGANQGACVQRSASMDGDRHRDRPRDVGALPTSGLAGSCPGCWKLENEGGCAHGGMWVISVGIVHVLANSGFQALGRGIGMWLCASS